MKRVMNKDNIMPPYESAAHLHLKYTYVASVVWALFPDQQGQRKLKPEVVNALKGVEQLLYKD